MSLLTSLGTGARALHAHENAVRVAGHNIANAATEGYTRQRVHFRSSTPEDLRVGILGRGVEIDAISRLADDFLNKSLRKGSSDLKSLDIQQQALGQTQGIFQELSDGDLSTAMTEFFDALDDLSQNPQDTAVRRAVVEKAKSLSRLFNTVRTNLQDLRKSLNDGVGSAVTEVNSLLNQVADLNQKILTSEFGGASGSRNANDLRDQRDLALRKLSEYVEIRVFEQSDGQVNVFADGDPLVMQNTANLLTTSSSSSNGLSVSTPIFSSNNGPLTLRSGRLHGLVHARDTAVPKYLTDLNSLATSLIQEVNKVHASGQGLTGYSTVTGANKPTSTTADLDAAGLDLAPVNGSFNVHVVNQNTGEIVTTNIAVDLDNLATDTTLASLRTAIDAVSNISASIGTDNALTISADSTDYRISFSGDTSNVLAALGINVLFTGEDASDIAVSSVVDNDVTKLAAAQNNTAGDNANALALAGLRTSKVMSSDTLSLMDFYLGSVGTLGVEAAEKTDGFQNQQLRLDLLENQRQEISGVNVDEEMVQLIEFQRTFQASARYIGIVDTMLDTLVNGLF